MQTDVLLYAVVALAVCSCADIWMRRHANSRVPWRVWLVSAALLIAAWLEADRVAGVERARLEQILVSYVKLFALNLERLGHENLSLDAPPDDPLYLRLLELQREWLSPDGHGEGARPRKFVMIDVIDTGCGMDEQTRKRVFEPFFTRYAPESTGLSEIADERMDVLLKPFQPNDLRALIAKLSARIPAVSA